MSSIFPQELLELFQEQTENEFPFDGPNPFTSYEGHDYSQDWKFYVREGVGILKCSLRDVEGNEEDFEWELNLKNP